MKTRPRGIKTRIPELFISGDAESITWFYLPYEVPSAPQWRVRPGQSAGDGGADEEDEDEDEDAGSGSKADSVQTDPQDVWTISCSAVCLQT